MSPHQQSKIYPSLAFVRSGSSGWDDGADRAKVGLTGPPPAICSARLRTSRNGSGRSDAPNLNTVKPTPPLSSPLPRVHPAACVRTHLHRRPAVSERARKTRSAGRQLDGSVDASPRLATKRDGVPDHIDSAKANITLLTYRPLRLII
ncbi:unnamed protein product [Lampetra planeri]